MPSEKEIQKLRLEMHNTAMNSCSCQEYAGQCSGYNEDYCVYEENQQECPKSESVRESEEFFKSRRNKIINIK